MPPSVVLRRKGGHHLVLFVVLVAAASSMAACGSSSKPSSTTVPRVLGEPQGTPLVVGQAAPNGTGVLAAVSCATSTRCWAVGAPGPDPTSTPPLVITTTRNGGVTWSDQRVPSGVSAALRGVSCPTASDCMAVGSNTAGNGLVLVTHDGGKVWTAATPAPGALDLTAVQCTGTQACTVIATNGTTSSSARSTDFGATWHPGGDLPSSLLAADDLTCSVAGTCLVAGFVAEGNGHGTGAIAVSTDGGKTWGAASVPSGIGLLQGVSCNPAVCLAVGTTSTTISDVTPGQGELLRSTDGGHSWTAVTPPPVEDGYGVSCPTTALCTIVGANWTGNPAVASGAVAQSGDGGTTFRASSAAYVPLALTSVSCPSPTGCVAVGGDTLARVTLAPANSRTNGAHHTGPRHDDRVARKPGSPTAGFSGGVS